MVGSVLWIEPAKAPATAPVRNTGSFDLEGRSFNFGSGVFGDADKKRDDLAGCRAEPVTPRIEFASVRHLHDLCSWIMMRGILSQLP
jgi:hypothetical protein